MNRSKASFKAVVKRRLNDEADNPPMKIGERIKQRRLELGLSVKTVADAADVEVQAVYQWEKGDTKQLRAPSLIGLIEVLKVTPRYLVFGTLPKEPIPASVSEEEWKLVSAYRNASDEGKRFILGAISQFLDKAEAAENGGN